ncbi:MAG: M23 family metallopeptidase [Kofleriaceae bacterium]
MNDIALVLNPPKFVRGRCPPVIVTTTEASFALRVWPLASINGRGPIVFDARNAESHGVDLAYPRFDNTDAIESCPIGSPNGTLTHLMPAMTPALAIESGEITFAGRHGHGFGIIINHGNGWASHYANLHSIVAIRTDLYRPRAQHVRAGDPIGYVGAPSSTAFKRLHFELWQRSVDHHFAPIDPCPHLATWKVLEHHDAFTPAPPGTRSEAA